MKKLIAIGGGENGRVLENGKNASYDTEKIDKEIIKLTGKEKPNYLFLGHAFSNIPEAEESYYQTMKKIYGKKFNCNCDNLKSSELNNLNIVKEKIAWADIIYEGGGDTEEMLKLWHSTGFDNVLYEAWIDGKVICGISAGAVCWFNSCNTENSSEFKCLECLNWINVHMTPHCNESGRYDSAKAQLKDRNIVGIMLSNGAALEILDNKVKLIISDTMDFVPFGIKSYWKNNRYYEKYLIENEIFDLEDLINMI